MVTYDDFETDELGLAIDIDGSGNIIVVGATGDTGSFEVLVLRYDSNGDLDTTFDTDGIVTTAVTASQDDFIHALAIDDQGRIVVAGGTIASGTDYDYALARYTTTGSLDTTFNTDGKVTLDINSKDDFARAMLLDSLGRVVLAGFTDDGTLYDLCVTRFWP